MSSRKARHSKEDGLDPTASTPSRESLAWNPARRVADLASRLTEAPGELDSRDERTAWGRGLALWTSICQPGWGSNMVSWRWVNVSIKKCLKSDL